MDKPDPSKDAKPWASGLILTILFGGIAMALQPLFYFLLHRDVQTWIGSDGRWDEVTVVVLAWLIFSLLSAVAGGRYARRSLGAGLFLSVGFGLLILGLVGLSGYVISRFTV